MEAPNIGQTTGSTGRRDAIHVAVIQVQAGCRLSPGTPVTVVAGYRARQVHPRSSECHGVVDPYLKEDVGEGGWFWLFLTPGSTRDLRHEWSHPAFDGNEKPILERMGSLWDNDDECRGC
jgi:hypothetical protein